MPKGVGRKIRVAVVDDDEDMHLLIKDVLQGTRDFTCVGGFSNAAEALTSLPRLRPDLILMDIGMPGVSGIECTRRLKQALPRVKVVMITGLHDANSIENALQAGADAYLIKPITSDQCLAALKFATAHRRRRKASQRESAEIASSAFSAKLTTRDNEVMKLLARGFLYKEIAGKLGMSYSAVHKHQHHIFKKLRVGNRSEAIRKWFEAGGKG